MTPTERFTETVLGATAAAVLAGGVLFAAGTLDGRGGLELVSHFAVQLLVGAAGAAGLLALARRRRRALACGAVAALASMAVLPWVLPRDAPAPPPDTVRVRVVLANVLTANRDHAAVRALATETEPDILALQEVSAGWLTGLEPITAALPHIVAEPRDDNFGIALFSRLPLTEASVVWLGRLGVPSIAATAEVGGVGALELLVTHPMPPRSPSRMAQRNDQLVAVAHHVAGRPRPLIVAGDLNTAMWSPDYRRLVGATGLENARRGFGIRPTWPTLLPPPLRIPIDHVLVSDGIVVLDCRTGPPIGSDHLPLIADLAVPALGGRAPER